MNRKIGRIQYYSLFEMFWLLIILVLSWLFSIEIISFIQTLILHQHIGNSKTISFDSTLLTKENGITKYKIRKWPNYVIINLTNKLIEEKVGEESDWKIDDKRIFFHETSGRDQLSYRQWCAVESAALHNPSRLIQVFMNGKTINFSDILSISVLSLYGNIIITLLDEKEYFKETSLNDWYTKGSWRNSSYKITHLAQYTRMVSMWRHGGLYMDLDLITTRALDEKMLRNFFVSGHKKRNLVSPNLSDCVFHLERNHRLIYKIIIHLAKDYDPEDEIYTGKSVITAVMRDICQVRDGLPSTNRCHDAKVLPYRYFLPISMDDWLLIFDNTSYTYSLAKTFFNEGKYKDSGKNKKEIRSTSYFGIYTWNSKSYNYPLVSGSLYENIMLTHCPITAKYLKAKS